MECTAQLVRTFRVCLPADALGRGVRSLEGCLAIHDFAALVRDPAKSVVDLGQGPGRAPRCHVFHRVTSGFDAVFCKIADHLGPGPRRSWVALLSSCPGAKTCHDEPTDVLPEWKSHPRRLLFESCVISKTFTNIY